MASQDIQASEILNLFGTLIDQTDSNGTFLTTGNTPLITAYSLLNLGVQDVAKTIVSINENYYLDKFEASSTAGQREYTMPLNLRNPKMVYIDYTATGNNFKRAWEFNIRNLNDINTIEQQFSKEQPHYYLRGLQTIGFLPMPEVTTDSEKPIQIWGIALPDKVSSLTSNIRIPREAIEIVAYKMAAIVLKDMQYHEFVKEKKKELESVLNPRAEDQGLLDQTDSMYTDSFNSYDDDYSTFYGG